MKARITRLLAAGFSAAAVLMFSVPITAQAAVPGSAEGDSYAAYAQAFLLGAGPITVGPIAAARAAIPPGSDPQVSHSGVVNYSDATSQLSQLIRSVNALDDNAKATLGTQASTECPSPGQVLPDVTPPFKLGPLTGGNACSHVANVRLLPMPGAALGGLVAASAIDVQSLTQSCTATPYAAANFVGLSVLGQAVTIPVSPNTEIDMLPLAKVILNEQIYDNHGHGLTVNGVHVILGSALGQLANVDVIAAHAHSMAACSDSSTTDTGTLPGIGGTHPRPVVTKTDSTKVANRGETVVYTIKIDPNTCPITSVTDVLPSGFHYVSSAGNLGTPVVTTLANGQQMLFWSSGGQAFSAPPSETVTVVIDPNEPNGDYTNLVVGTSDCGSFAGIDLIGLNTGPPANQGNNPGIIVPRPAPPAAPAAPPASGTEAAALTTPFTGTGAPDAAIWLGASLLALLSFAGVGVIQARRVIRATRVD
jgi:uncharacterized repeat protein (TIGR01451 family)